MGDGVAYGVLHPGVVLGYVVALVGDEEAFVAADGWGGLLELVWDDLSGWERTCVLIDFHFLG